MNVENRKAEGFRGKCGAVAAEKPGLINRTLQKWKVHEELLVFNTGVACTDVKFSALM